LPCSEAAVERAFSHLRIICGDHRHSLKPDLLDALLVNRLHGDSSESPTGLDPRAFCESLERMNNGTITDDRFETILTRHVIRRGLTNFANGHRPTPNAVPPQSYQHHRWGEEEIGRRLRGINPKK
jgi:hypothetical protein